VKQLVVAILFLSAVVPCAIRAADSDRAFTLDLTPGADQQSLPPWMTGEPVAAPATHATISFPIRPPQDDSDLAVTFYFTETPGGFLRVYWAGTTDSEMLTDNLYEGISMPNQRTLLIKRSTLSSAGTLNIQSSEPSLNISRIHWEWVDPATVSLAAPAKQTALVNASGAAIPDGEVNGAPQLPKSDKIGSSVVTATVTDKPQRIEAGVEFIGTLEQRPQYARLEVKMAGVPIGKPVQLLLNGAAAGDVALEVPEIEDPGYQAASGSTPPAYIGWRKGVLYLQPGLLNTGDNRFQFVIKDSDASAPLAVKDFILQLKYGPPPADSPDAAAASVPVPDPTPTAPAVSPTPAPAPSPEPVAANPPPGS
jgi:hypothetical protein